MRFIRGTTGGDPPLRGYAWAVIAVAIATAIGWPLYHKLHLSNTNVLMLYLLVVLWIATRYTRGAAIIASVLGVAAFDIVFVPPYYTLTVHDQQYVVTFAVMLITAVVISDLTVRSRTQAEAAREARQRAEAERLRNTLLSGVSHELRTPLAGITGAASALAEAGDGMSPDARREMLDTLSGEADRMERLINNLLDMTRLEYGGVVLKLEWQPLQEVVGAALNHLARRLRDRQVITRVPDDLPLVRIDSVAIEQVLVNLIENALQHTSAQSDLEIVAAAKDSALIVEVRDRGPGIPAGMEERIFEKFFRAGQGDGRRSVGLGLAICRGLVQAHGGSITAEARDGGGAVFRFTLPLTESPAIQRGPEER